MMTVHQTTRKASARVEDRLHTLLDRFLPASLADRGMTAVRRGKIAIALWLTVIIWAPIYALVYYLMGLAEVAASVLAACVLAFAVPWVLRCTKSVLVTGNYVAFDVFWVLMFIAWHTGGEQAPAMLWTPVPVLVSMCIAGLLSGVVWGVLSVAALAAFHVLQRQGFAFDTPLTHEQEHFLYLIALGSLVVVVLTVSYFYEWLNAWAVKELSERRAALGRTNQDLKRMQAELLAMNQSLQEEVVRRRLVEADLKVHSKALEAAANTIVITDRAGRVEWANPAFTRLTGYAVDEVRGRTPRLLKSGRHDEAFYRDLWLTILAKRVWHGEIVNRRKDGSLYTEEMTITPVIDEHGEIVRFIAVKQDVTERKRMEEERLGHAVLEHETQQLREAKEAAERANRAKSEFLATMSHELRTPLNGVIVMSDLLLSTGLDEKQRRFAWLAKSSGELLLSLINDILDLSKIEAGRLELEEVEFELHEVMGKVCACLRIMAEKKRVVLRCLIDPRTPRRMIGDPGRLQQIVTNLVNNAIKFTQTGQVLVRVSLEESTETHDRIRVTVTDTGIRIDADRQADLFKPFSQLDASTTRVYGGTGLGLAICRRLVELMGGEIGVQSTPGRGSTFYFVVPLRRAPGAGTMRPRCHADLRGLRVLVVDPDEFGRMVMTDVLASAGLKGSASAGGEEALATLRSHSTDDGFFDIVLVDEDLHDIQPAEVAERIVEDPQLQHVIVLWVGESPDRNEETLRSAGFAGCVTKPVQIGRLLSALAESLACAGVDIPCTADTCICREHAASAASTPEAESGARILLAEDNAVNQEAAIELLRRAGHPCDAVGNGREAVEAALSGRYDLILMDCQMPEMDGFEATRRIREHERQGRVLSRAGGRIPIVALTANAIKGDRERCLEAGMDEYLAKPIDTRELRKTVDRLANAEQPTADGAPCESSGPAPGASEIQADGGSRDDGSGPFDLERLLATWQGDSAFAFDLIAKFCDRTSADIAELERHLTAGDGASATRLAHSIKGAAGYAEAPRIRELAERIEALSSDDQLERAAASLTELEAEMRQCLEVRAQHAQNHTTASPAS